MAALALRPSDPRSAVVGPQGFFCGGTLIAPDRILTAAHCVYGESPSRIDVILGDGDLVGSVQPRLPLKGISTYPGYSPFSNAKDISILQLAAQVDVRPVPLVDPAQAAQLPAGTAVRALGRGVTSPSSDPDDISTQLLQADLSLIADATCERQFPRRFHPYSQLCVGDAPGRGVCFGDSGGPLLVGSEGAWYELGVASEITNPRKCVTDRFPALFSRLSTLGGFALSPNPTYAPYNLRRPKIRGKLKPGATLRCLPGRWNGQHNPYRYRWFRGNVSRLGPVVFERGIKGARHRRLRVTPALTRSGVLCRVQAGNLGGLSIALARRRR